MQLIFNIIIGVVIILYVLFTVSAYKKIQQSVMFNDSQKRINSILIWCIPFIWHFMIKGLLKPSETMTKSKRKIDKSFYYESGLGDSP